MLGLSVKYSAIVILSCLGLLSCQTAEELKQKIDLGSYLNESPSQDIVNADVQSFAAPSGEKKTSFMMGKTAIEKDAKSDAYKVCLTPVQHKQWVDRLHGKRVSGGPEKGFFGKGLHGQINRQFASEIFGEIATPMIFAGSFAAQLASAVKGANGGSSAGICGNWCGPGYPKSNANPKVTDALDAACKVHDLCYRNYGAYNCMCDQLLVDSIMKNRTLFDVSTIERNVALYFSGSSCNFGCKTFQGHEVCGGMQVYAGGKQLYSSGAELSKSYYKALEKELAGI